MRRLLSRGLFRRPGPAPVPFAGPTPVPSFPFAGALTWRQPALARGLRVLGRGTGENIGHVNTEIDGEKEDGTISNIEWMGEPTPEANKEKIRVKGEWNPDSRRTGVIGTKVGMMNVWDARGVRQLVTVIKLDECQVTQIRRDWTPQGEKFVHLQVGAGSQNVRRMRKAAICFFRKVGVPPKKKLCEFKVSDDAVLPVGTTLTARHFVPGQYVDVSATTVGRGFAGGMKRWKFGGQAASHGVSLTHRAIGAVGACQDPGKIWKGKKMPGRMGGKRATILNKQVYKIDTRRDLLFLKGCIPGNNGAFIEIQDARKKKWNPKHPPPYPTFESDPNAEHVDELLMDVSHLQDPFKLAVS